MLAICVFAMSCNSTKKTSPEKAKELTEKGGAIKRPFTPKENLLEQLDYNRINADWLSGKANIAIETQGKSITLMGIVQLRKDSAMLLVLKKFGIEAVRALITRDSVRVLNRLSGEYMSHPLSYIAETFNIPADFKVLQDIIIGNPPLMDREKVVFTQQDSTYNLVGSSAILTSEYQFDNKYNLKTARLQQLATENTLLLKYDNYKVLNNKRIAYTRTLEANDLERGKTSVEMEFTEMELNVPKTMRCEIPSRYKKVEVFEF